MAMNPKDLQLANGERQPVRERGRISADRRPQLDRTFKHQRLHTALAMLGVVRRVKP